MRRTNQSEHPRTKTRPSTLGFNLRIVVILGLGITSTSCATVWTKLERTQERAAWDLNCPYEKIQITEIGDNARGATGCGRRATYTLVNCNIMNWESVCKAVLNSEVESVSPG